MLKAIFFFVLMLLASCRSAIVTTKTELKAILHGCPATSASAVIQERILSCQDVSGRFADTVSTCLTDLYDSLNALEPACFQAYKEEVAQLGYQLIAGQASFLGTVTDAELKSVGFTENRVRQFFENINVWFGNYVSSLYTFSGANSQAAQAQTEVLNLVETAMKLSNRRSTLVLRDRLNGATTTSSNADAALLATWAFRYLEHPETIASFAGPILEAIEDRQKILDRIHDYNCLVQKCEGTRPEATEYANIVKAMAEILDPTIPLPIRPQMNSETIEFLRTAKVNSRKFTSFLRTASSVRGSDGLSLSTYSGLYTLKLGQAPVFFRPILNFIQTQNQRFEAFSKTKLFSGRNSQKIAFDLKRESLSRINGATTQALAQVQERLDRYNQARSDLLLALNSKLEDEQTLSFLDIERRSLEFDLDKLVNDVTTLGDSILSERERYDINLAQIAKLKEKETSVFETDAKVFADQTVVTLNPSEARAVEPDASISEHSSAVIDRVPNRTSAQIVQLEVTGEWSPTCALNQSAFRTGSAPLVGPEGYRVSYINSKADLSSFSKSNRTTKYEDKSFSKSACASAQVGFGRPLGSIGFGSASLSSSYCRQSTTGKRTESIESSDSSTQDSFLNQASFTAGLRLDGTPAPLYPAGALLAFITDSPGQRLQDVTQVYVVNRTNTFTLNQQQRLYLVINDCKGGSTTSPNLVVNARRLIPEADIAEDYLTAMNGVILKADSSPSASRLKDLAKRGLVTPTDLQALRSELLAEFAATAPDLTSMAFPVLNQIFTSFVENLLANIERKSRYALLDRELERISFAIDKNDAAKTFTQKKQSLREELVQGALHNSDLKLFGKAVPITLSFVNDVLMPVVNLHFPKVFNDGQYQVAISGASPLDLNFVTTIREYKEAVARLNQTLSFQLSYLADYSQMTIVALKLPKPSLDQTSMIDDGSSPLATFSMTSQFWEALENVVLNKKPVAALSFGLTPDDLYRADQSGDRLNCFQSRPIVESMVLAFSINDPQVQQRVGATGTRHSLPLRVGPTMDYILPGVNEKLELAPLPGVTGLGSYTMGIRFFDFASPNFEQYFGSDVPHNRAMYGLSPFTDYNLLNLRALQSVIKQECPFSSFNCIPWSSLDSAYLLMKIQAQNDDYLSQIYSCRDQS